MNIFRISADHESGISFVEEIRLSVHNISVFLLFL